MYDCHNVVLVNMIYLFFINNDGDLILKQDQKFICLNKNVCCKYIRIKVGHNHSYHNFAVILYHDYKISIQVYEYGNTNIMLIQEKSFSVDFYIDKIYDNKIIDNLGNVYNYNLHSLLCYGPSNTICISDNDIVVVNKEKLNYPIKEIFHCYNEENDDPCMYNCYLTNSGLLLDGDNNIIMTDIIGSHVSVTTTKSSRSVTDVAAIF